MAVIPNPKPPGAGSHAMTKSQSAGALPFVLASRSDLGGTGRDRYRCKRACSAAGTAFSSR
jgi:hypothetical protein